MCGIFKSHERRVQNDHDGRTYILTWTLSEIIIIIIIIMTFSSSKLSTLKISLNDLG